MTAPRRLKAGRLAVIADRDHVPFLEKWGGSLGGPAKMAVTNKCLAQSNKSHPPSKATKRRNAMNEYRQGRGRSARSM
jgi:hypothetical protein